MRVRTAVLSALALLPVASSHCVSTWNCHPDREMFSLDEPVTAAELDALIAAGYTGQTSWETVKCETVCMRKYNDVRRWETSQSKIKQCTLTLPPDRDGTGAPGQVTCAGEGLEYFCEGRRPLGHHEAGDRDCPDPRGRDLAAMAYLEAASVHAFEQLARWLSERDAPESLVQRCLRAADDERHHARWLRRLARLHGATVPLPRADPVGRASVQQVAAHNAVEGCVHESFAALLAAIRAQRADDARLRAVFGRIASDEIRHGQLAWDLHAWLCARLSPHHVRVVARAQRDAMRRLPDRAHALLRTQSRALGVVEPDQARRLAAAFVEQLAA